MGGLGTPELIIVLLVVLLLFGGAKLPELARSLGQAKNEFKKAEAEAVTPTLKAEPTPAANDTTATKTESDPS